MSLDDVRRHLADALIAVDFDGTLSAIEARPEDARPVPGAVDALVAVASRCRRLAVITGRPAAVVVELGGLDVVPGLVVLGHYGLQRWSEGELTTPAPVEGIAVARAGMPPLPDGARLEDKDHSLVVHTRGAADPDAAYAMLEAPLRALAQVAGLDLDPGRYVWELRPPGVDKGSALRALAASLSPAAVLVAGDDLGDLPMFAAASTLGVPCARVAVRSAGADPAVAAAADLTVDGPAALVALLTSLV